MGKLKEEFLRLLEEDREFRYAVAGLLGYGEVLRRLDRHEEELRKLREDFLAFVKEQERRWEENNRRWEENARRWEENNRRWIENERRWEEAFKRFEVIEKTLIEHTRILEEQTRILREHGERLERLEFRVEGLDRFVKAVAHRFGVLSEQGFREGLKHVVEEILGVAKVEKWVYHDVEGFVYGHPSPVEVDVVVRDGEHILIEIKSRVSRSDVSELNKIGKLYEKIVGVKPRLLIIAGFVDKGVEELARNLGVEITPLTPEKPEGQSVDPTNP